MVSFALMANRFDSNPSRSSRHWPRFVQRIMENLQVYRARFGGGTRLQIEADLHRGASVE